MHHVRSYASFMATPSERLKTARLRAGHETAKGAAMAMGATVSTYIQHENGSRGYPSSTAARYAKFFRVGPEWLLLSGDLAHLVDWAECGAGLSTGQIIEVTRYRDGGELREVTLKEVEVKTPGNYLLWPRSTNPRWKEPIILNGTDDDGPQVVVTGLLLASIRRF